MSIYQECSVYLAGARFALISFIIFIHTGISLKEFLNLSMVVPLLCASPPPPPPPPPFFFHPSPPSQSFLMRFSEEGLSFRSEFPVLIPPPPPPPPPLPRRQPVSLTCAITTPCNDNADIIQFPSQLIFNQACSSEFLRARARDNKAGL